jgi:hypothetical protein
MPRILSHNQWCRMRGDCTMRYGMQYSTDRPGVVYSAIGAIECRRVRRSAAVVGL